MTNTIELAAGEMETLVNALDEGDTITVVYHSATSGDVQEKTGEVIDADESWNGKAWEVEFKSGGEIYEVVAGKGDEAKTLNRIKYDWQRGERVSKVGTHRISSGNISDPIRSFEIESDGGSEEDVGEGGAPTKRAKPGAKVNVVGEHSHRNLGTEWEVLSRIDDGYLLTDSAGIGTLRVETDEVEVL